MGETEALLKRSERLLKLKGVEEPPKQPSPSPLELLRLYKKQGKPAEADAQSAFKNLRLEWNVDGTLSKLTVLKDNAVAYILDFVWNGDGTLNEIIRSQS